MNNSDPKQPTIEIRTGNPDSQERFLADRAPINPPEFTNPDMTVPTETQGWTPEEEEDLNYKAKEIRRVEDKHDQPTVRDDTTKSSA